MRDLIRLIRIIHILLRARLDVLVKDKYKSNLVSFLLLISPWKLYSLDQPRGERIRKALEEAGTIFIKFGQLLSTRPDLIPSDIAQSLHKLQDDIAAFPTNHAKEIIEAELNSDLEKIFTDFDPIPIAAASIAQVYSATLKETGRKVAIKVVRPGIDKEIDKDISLMKKIAKKAGPLTGCQQVKAS